MRWPHYEAGCHVSDPNQLTLALAKKVLERGARFDAHDVREIASQDRGIVLSYGDGSRETFEAVVLAAGAWSQPLAARLGDNIPLDTERGYNTTFPPGTLGLSRPVVFEGHGFVFTPLDTGDRIGGSVEFGGLKAAPNFKRMDVLLRRFQEFVPDAVLQGGRQWMGFRPSMPDSLPVISYPTQDRRIVYAFGHGHYGLTQAVVTARIVTHLVARTAPDIDPGPFSAQRF